MKNTVVGFINKPKNYINRIDKNTFVTNSGLLFYLLVWYLNPSNKLLVVFSLVLLIAIQLKLKDLSLSALLIFVITSIFLVGKSYIIQLYDLKAYPDLKIIYPFGLISQVTISISDVFFLLFAAALLIDCLKKKIIIRKLISVDILLLLFVIYGIFADVLSSKRFFFSLFLKKSIFEYALVYFYLRFWAKNINNFFSSFFSLIPVIVFFQSFVSIQQFLQSSPLGKNVEFNHGITTFGVVPDEINFVFRPIGTFDHANSLGIYLSSFLPFILLGVIINKSYLFAVSFLFGITTLLLSLSRSAWLAFFISLIGFLYYFEYKLKIDLIKKISVKKLIILIIFTLPLMFYALPRIGKTIYSFQESGGIYLRFQQISETTNLIFSHPLTGVGTGMSVVESIEAKPKGVFSSFPSAVHNYFVLLTVENGVPTLLLFLLIIFFTVKRLLAQQTIFSFISICSLVVIIIGGLFQPFFDFGLLLILTSLDYSKIHNHATSNRQIQT